MPGTPEDSSAAAARAATRACRPDQYDARDDWPVLHAEATPRLDTDRWTFTVEGLVEQPTTWTWAQMHALPPSRYAGDIHCVTTWSKLGMTFDGVSVDTLLDWPGPCRPPRTSSPSPTPATPRTCRSPT